MLRITYKLPIALRQQAFVARKLVPTIKANYSTNSDDDVVSRMNR